MSKSLHTWMYLSNSIHPEFSYVENAVKLTKTIHFDVCHFLQCSAVCVWSLPCHDHVSTADDKTGCGGDRGLQLLVVSAAVYIFSLLQCTCRHFVWCSTHVVGPWLSLGPGPVLYPATACHMDPVSRVQKLKISFNYVSACLCSLALALTWVLRKLPDLSSNQRVFMDHDL